MLQSLRNSSALSAGEAGYLDLDRLVENLASRDGAIHTLEGGKAVQRSYRQLGDDCIRAMDFLRSWNVAPGMRVGIYAPNSYCWLVYDLALLEIGAVSVAFTDDFKDNLADAASANDILAKYGVALLLTAKNLAPLLSHLRAPIAFIDDPDRNFGLTLPRPPVAACTDPDQLGLVFSSGSSGGLKGLVISRRGVSSTLPPLIQAVGIGKGDSLLLFLPMSNFQQRFLCYAALWRDFDIILVDPTQLFTALEMLEPTALLAPPVFYQMVHAEYLRKSRWIRARDRVIAALLWAMPDARRRRDLARRALRDFHRQFGGRIRLLVTGMAPIRPEIARLFHRMQLPLAEAYGMVETGVIAYRPGGCKDFTSVGMPLADVRLSFSADGEILVSRPYTVASGYFQCAEGEDKKTFLAPGIVATGDIGALDRRGRLSLLGRKKEIIVTSSGHKIHPEVMERELDAHPEIASSVVFMGHKSDLRCVITLNNPDDEEAKRRVKRFLTDHEHTRRLFSMVTVIFAEAPFTRENGMLRPNMKIDRRRVVERYGAA
ncbi:MAG TPA: AMP-binding protein [Rhizomicrobium sp.]|nr:AMP-binding protein [Rhizomicrobium sp.]